MPYIGIVVMTPVAGRAEEVERVSQEISDYAETLDGCLAAYTAKAMDGSGDLCRISIWESVEKADHGIQSLHAMALRSELNQMIRPDHFDRGFLA